MSRQGWRTKEAARIARAVRRAGGEVELTRRGHLRVSFRGRSTVIPSKLDSPRAHLNAVTTVRRAVGLDLGAGA